MKKAKSALFCSLWYTVVAPEVFMTDSIELKMRFNTHSSFLVVYAKIVFKICILLLKLG